MDKLKTVLKEVVESYSGKAENGYSHLTANTDETFFSIVSIGEYKGKRVSFTDIVVQIVGDKIIIEEDRNSDPLCEALMQAGIPREQIILAYAGEKIPDMAG